MRRTVEVGYPRGEETRTRILNVALSLFGTKGFDGVSTREIAAAASVPANSLRYYFGNKQDLYVACLNHTQTLAFQAMEPALLEAELLLEDRKADTSRLIHAFCAVQEALIDYMIGGSDRGTTALFVVRHDLPSEGGSGRLTGDGKVAYRMMACFTQLMMRISGNLLDAKTALIVAGLINGQLTAIYVSRNRLAEFGWDITMERLHWLKRTIRKQTTALLLAHR
jgi:TetR/AcrR family transcriptional regulator, regulator of cefoperazone and chloramphenicol sensitivity